jgi:hypothetical protein
MFNSVLLSALGAGLVAILATVAIERFGGKLGGLLASIPSTIIPASIGFWVAAQAPSDFEDALFAVPGGMFVTAGFLLSWRVMPPRLRRGGLYPRLALMTLSSLSLWGLGAALLTLFLGWQPWPMVVIGVVFFTAQLTVGLLACRSNPPAPTGTRRVGPIVLALRGLLAAAAIGTSVWIAGLGIPILAGMASVFPAIFLTTMAGLWLSQGEAVQAGAVGPMILGSTSVSAYCLLCTWTFPQLGPVAGSLCAWLGAVLAVSVPAWYRFARQRPDLSNA